MLKALFKRIKRYMIELSIRARDLDVWRLLHLLHSGKKRGRIVFYRATIDHYNVITGDIKMLILTDSQEVDLAIKPVDKKGNPAQVEGIPVWTTSDANIASVTPAADGLSAVVKAAAGLGDVQISVAADADLGPGVTTLTGTLDVSVVAGAAVTLNVAAGQPREQA